MHFSRRNKSKFKTAPAPSKRAAQSTPAYLNPIVLTVEETWETPDADQYDYARESYVEHLQKPFLKLETDRRLKTVLVTHKVERMIELAPDFFEKALSRSAFETGYFIEGRKNNARAKSGDTKT